MQECDNDGLIRIVKRKTNKSAIALRDEIIKESGQYFKPQTGTLEKERVLFNNRGIIFNFNNRKVGTNEEFLPSIIA